MYVDTFHRSSAEKVNKLHFGEFLALALPCQLIIRTSTGRLQLITSLLGSHNAYNLVAAVATGVALKAPLQAIVAGIEAVEIPGR